ALIYADSGTQTISTTGTLSLTAGTAVGTSGSSAKIINQGTGAQQVSAANITTQGGNSGFNNPAILLLNASAKAGQVINAGASGVTLNDGAGGGTSLIGSTGGGTGDVSVTVSGGGTIAMNSANGVGTFIEATNGNVTLSAATMSQGA